MRWLTLLLMFFLFSCGHYKSGQYVQLDQDSSTKSLSDQFSIPEWALVDANPGKKFVRGEWVFIPLRRGLLARRTFEQPKSHEAQEVYTLTLADKGRFLWPVPSVRKISSGYGPRWGREHHGIDIGAPRGTYVVAADDGIVIYSGDELGGYGNLTVISHGDGLFSVYAHTKKNFTVKGQRVHRGQVIATVGNTGRSTGPHLHFEIRHSGKAINPEKILALK